MHAVRAHTGPVSRILLPLLSGLALLGCVGEAEWQLEPSGENAPAAVPTAPEERSKLTSFQGLSSGLPANANPAGIAHLDGTVYLVVDGALFSLPTGAKAWTQVALELAVGERVTSVTRVDLALLIATSEGLLKQEFGDEKATRVANAPKGAVAVVKKGSELLAATPSGVFASKDRGTTFTVRSTRAFSALVASAASARMFAVDAGGLVFSDDVGATWKSGLVEGQVKALSAAGEFVLVETTAGAQRSDNYGTTFHPVTIGAQALGFGFSGKKAFAGTMTGVRVSDDGGKSWRDGNEGLPAATQVKSVWVAGPAVIAATPTQVFVAELF